MTDPSAVSGHPPGAHDAQSAAALQALVEEMARFPEMNPGPVARLEPNGIVLRANLAAERLFGRDTLEGASFWELVPGLGDDAAQRLVDGETLHRDVQIGDAWLTFTLIFEPASGHIFVYGTEITAQKAAEQELEDRARFPQMNPGPVARLRADGTVLRANPAAARVFGRDDLKGADFRVLCPGIGDDVWSRIVDGEQVTHEEDIDERCYAFTLVHEPKSGQVFVYGADVTELRVAEREAADLARFPEMNPGPVLRMTTDASVLLANRAARRIFGSEVLGGRSWLELCPTVTESFWTSVLAADEPVALEARVGDRDYLFHHAPGPDGLFVFVYGSDVTAQKKAEGALRQSEKMATLGTLAAGVAHELNNPAAAVQRASEQLEKAFASLQKAQLGLRDHGLTEAGGRLLAELEAQAREAVACPCEIDPLERSDREAEIEDWLDERGIEDAWEIAPPLVDLGYDVAGLQGLSERGAGDHAATFGAWQAHAHKVYCLLQEISQGSGRLVEIVGAMKSYAYLGQAPVQNLDLNEGLRNTLVILRSKLKRGVVVSQELDASLPRIHGYGSELNQVWTNLIDNAVDAMNGEGRLTLRSGVRDGVVFVEVEDDGPGIPADVRSRIYDAFFTTKPPGRGTGLGLNTTYNVVQKHGGSIDVRSEPGKTVFTVTLPVTPPPELVAESSTDVAEGE